MSIEYRGVYGGPHGPDRSAPWIVQVAAELEGITTSVADHGVFIETATPDVQHDVIVCTYFLRRTGRHHTDRIRAVTASYAEGFDPPLTPLQAAQLIVVECAEPG